MQTNPLNIFLLIAASQGLFFSVFTFHKYGGSLANRILSLLMLGFSIILLNMLAYELNYYEQIPRLLMFIVGIGLLIPPLHFLYALYLINNYRVFRKLDWLHFIPFVVYEIISLPKFFMSTPELVKIAETSDTVRLSSSDMMYNWVITIQTIVYLLLTLYVIRKYSRQIKNVFSSLDKIKLDWLKNITYAVFFTIMIFLLENALMIKGLNLSHNFDLSSLLAALYVYFLGYLGLYKSDVFTSESFAESINELKNEEKAAKSSGENQKKYVKSGLSETKADQILKDLLKLMSDEKPYADSELTLNKLAVKLSVSPHNLSEVINTTLEQNFFDFVNSYRVESVKTDLLNPEKQNLTVLAIAMEAGFNSKSSFNSIFKKQTGLTPSQYKDSKMNISPAE